MVNQELIKGAGIAASGGNDTGGFFNAADSIVDITSNNSNKIAARAAAQKAEKRSINNKIGGYISKMKSNVDLTGISDEQRKSIQGFLLGQRGIYVDAANKIAKLEPNDPAYLEQSDIMTAVNNSFQNLSNNLGVYKKNQAEFVDDFQNNRLSDGDLVNKKQASAIYDPSTTFTIDRGNLAFNIDGKEINFKDFKAPAHKAFSTATSIMKMANTLYSNGQKMTPLKAQTIKLQLEEALNQDPSIARSLAADGFFNGKALNINPDLINESDPEAFNEAVAESIFSGLSTAAKDGVAEKARVAAKKAGLAAERARIAAERARIERARIAAEKAEAKENDPTVIGGNSLKKRTRYNDFFTSMRNGEVFEGGTSMNFNITDPTTNSKQKYTMVGIEEGGIKFKKKGDINFIEMTDEDAERLFGIKRSLGSEPLSTMPLGPLAKKPTK